jgi:hypothetical protein
MSTPSAPGPDESSPTWPGPVPVLGTAAWVALPDTDPRKLAAAIAPALARLIENTPAAVALRLRRELLAEDRAVANRLKAASLALSTAQDWVAAARRPTYAELERRRAQFATTTAGRDAA